MKLGEILGKRVGQLGRNLKGEAFHKYGNHIVGGRQWVWENIEEHAILGQKIENHTKRKLGVEPPYDERVVRHLERLYKVAGPDVLA